jgi:hypothetical protein
VTKFFKNLAARSAERENLVGVISVQRWMMYPILLLVHHSQMSKCVSQVIIYLLFIVLAKLEIKRRR